MCEYYLTCNARSSNSLLTEGTHNCLKKVYRNVCLFWWIFFAFSTTLKKVIALVLFIFGLFIGSFLNVVIDRLPRGESFWSGRSYCEACHHTLSGLDLIPLFSYLALRGKCRYCHIPLSIQYPLLEAITGIVFALSYIFSPKNSLLDIIFFLIIASVLIIVFFIDLFEGIIPFVIIIPATILTFLYLLATKIPSDVLISFLTALGASGFFLALFLGTKGKGMGFGDVVYAFFMGLLLGFPNTILGLYIAFLTGAAISLILILRKRKRLRGSTIPFGPFLVLGTYSALIWGNLIVNHIFQTIL